MSNVNALLNERLKKTENSSKMAAMAKQSATGNLTSFSGVFSVSELSETEKTRLESLLEQYAVKTEDVKQDLTSLISITAEVKAINNQAAILHGERIKKAHSILTRYRDGAFSAWLIAAYGNRQTPYNFMQYFAFYEAMPKSIRPMIEAMPRQAVYTLASREGPLDKKQKVVESYQGETKAEVLQKIREIFPLEESDRRKKNMAESLITSLKRICEDLKGSKLHLSKSQRDTIEALLDTIHSKLKN